MAQTGSMQTACSSSIGAPLTWDEAHACAADKLKLLNQSEKASLLLGVGWNTSAAIIKQYGFPQLEKWHYAYAPVEGTPYMLALTVKEVSPEDLEHLPLHAHS